MWIWHGFIAHRATIRNSSPSKIRMLCTVILINTSLDDSAGVLYGLSLFAFGFLMARSRRNFNYGWWRRRWCRYNHIFNCTNMILNFDQWLLWALETTLGSGHRLHIKTGFNFRWNICESKKEKRNEIKQFFVVAVDERKPEAEVWAWEKSGKSSFEIFALCPCPHTHLTS